GTATGWAASQARRGPKRLRVGVAYDMCERWSALSVDLPSQQSGNWIETVSFVSGHVGGAVLPKIPLSPPQPQLAYFMSAALLAAALPAIIFSPAGNAVIAAGFLPASR